MLALQRAAGVPPAPLDSRYAEQEAYVGSPALCVRVLELGVQVQEHVQRGDSHLDVLLPVG